LLNVEEWQEKAEESVQTLAQLVRLGAATDDITGTVRRRLDEHRNQARISIAVIGQYDAGKSTIISALTGRNDIPISGDITTDRCTAYEWSSLRIVDTPGLYAGRPEHDRITNDEIDHSDLLAFCLTSELFDHITLPNFRRLAQERLYASKMMLVVNKLFAEDGDIDERVATYAADLDRMLGSDVLRKIPKVFVDAKLYRDGLQRKSDRLVALSRFADLVAALNKLSAERGLLARADTPLRIVLRGTNDAIFALSGGEEKDKAFIHLLSRFLEAVTLSRAALHRDFVKVANQSAAVVLDESESLMAALDGAAAAQFAATEQRCRENIQGRLQQLHEEVRGMIIAVGHRLQNGAREIESLPLFTHFAGQMNTDVPLHATNAEIDGLPRIRNQLVALQNLANGIGGVFSVGKLQVLNKVHPVPAAQLVDSAADGGAMVADLAPSTRPTGAHLSSATTSYVDDAITGTVDHLNKHFHWHVSADGALNASHHLTHILNIAGPVLALVSAGVSAYAMYKEERATEDLGKLRTQLRKNIDEAKENARSTFENLGREIDAAVFRPLEDDTRAQRTEGEVKIKTGNNVVDGLRQLRDRLEGYLRTLSTLPG
jgi:hypothetical protein